MIFQSLFVSPKSGVIFLTEYDISQIAPRLRHGTKHETEKMHNGRKKKEEDWDCYKPCCYSLHRHGIWIHTLCAGL